MDALQNDVQLAVREADEVLSRNDYQRVALAVDQVSERGISSDTEYDRAAELLKIIAAGRKAVEEYWEPKVSAANRLHKMLTKARAQFLERLDELRDRLEKPMRSYRLKTLEQLETARKEAARLAEQLRKQKEAEAKELARKGDVEASVKLMAEAEAISEPVFSEVPRKPDWPSERWEWDIRITDPMALVCAIADGAVPIDAIKEWNLSIMKKIASTSGGLDWPGVRATKRLEFTVRNR